VSDAVRSGELALSWGVQGDDAPRLIIPLVRIEPSQPAEPVAHVGGVEAAGLTEPCGGVEVWATVAAHSADLVLVLDATGRVLALSAAAAELIGAVGPHEAPGRHLLDVLDLVDFNPTPGDASMYADRIPPLLAIASNALSRGLLRVRTGERTITVDAVAAPVHDVSGVLVGAVAFLARLSS